MRVNKKVLAVIIVVAFAAVLGYLFMTYSGLVADRQALEDRLTVAQGRVPGLVAEKDGLQTQKVSATSGLDQARAKYPQDIHSIEYGEHVWEIVKQCNLTMTGLSFPRPSAVTEGAVSFQVVSLSLPVRGTISDIFEFIRVLRTDERFASTRVKSISLSLDGETASATLSVDIYGHRR